MGLRGAPDDYHLRPRSATYPVGDLGELAARLGSIVTHDRRGDVVLLANFEDGLGRWRTEPEGEGSTAGLSVARARSGGYSVQLHAAAVAGAYARIHSYAPYRAVSSVGLEVAFTVDPLVDFISWYLDVFTGSKHVRALAEYYPGTDLLRVRTGALTYYNVDSALLLYDDDYLFHVVKLVVDLDDAEYVRLLVDGNEYDLSAYSPYWSADIADPYIRVQINATGDGSNAADIYIDDVIITQDEP